MQNKAPRVYKDCSAAKVVWLLVFVAILIIGLAVSLALTIPAGGAMVHFGSHSMSDSGTWVSAGVLVPSSLVIAAVFVGWWFVRC